MPTPDSTTVSDPLPRLAQRAERRVEVVGVGEQQLAFGGDEEPAARARPDDGGQRSGVPAPHAPLRVEREQVAGQHVHPAQAAPARVPRGALAVVGDGFCHGMCGDRHAGMLTS
nr:hypothetical protein [Nonomuraea sp. C10]